MRPPTVLGLALLALVPRSARAQHAEAGGGAEWRCGLCHGSHGGAPAAYNLKTDDVEVWGPADRLGAVSRSCLRCHAGPDFRRRQAEMGGHPAGPDEAYLGSDLTSQHPMGPVDRARARTPFTPLRTSRRATRGPASGMAGTSIECTACHDPHQPPGRAGAPREEETCGSCHDPVAYQLGHETLRCADCHAMHARAPGTALLRGGPTDLTCRRCHDPSASGVTPLAPPAHTQASTTVGRNCLTCHKAHGH